MNKNNFTKNNAILIKTVLLTGIIGIFSSLVAASGEIYQSAKCDNTNVNINGIEQTQLQRQFENNELDQTLNEEDLMEEEALDVLLNGDGESLLNIERNIVNVCINDNENTLTESFTES